MFVNKLAAITQKCSVCAVTVYQHSVIAISKPFLLQTISSRWSTIFFEGLLFQSWAHATLWTPFKGLEIVDCCITAKYCVETPLWLYFRVSPKFWYVVVLLLVAMSQNGCKPSSALSHCGLGSFEGQFLRALRQKWPKGERMPIKWDGVGVTGQLTILWLL